MKFLKFVLILVFCASCAERDPNLTPQQVLISQANEAVVALGTLQHAAIELNGITVCDSAAPPVCKQLLSRDNTEIVVDIVTDSLLTIKAVPAGWKATGLAAADRIEQRLDAAGKTKFAGYVAALRAVIQAIIP